MDIITRAARPDEENFLFRVYASTRADELAPVPWTGNQKESFLRMQSEAQLTDYRRNHPTAQFMIIEKDGQRVGRMFLDRQEGIILLMDIALLPEFRNQGIGTTLIEELLAQAGKANCCVRLHVELFNPAKTLYTRLGFVKSNDLGIYEEMTWKSPGSSISPSVPPMD